MTLGWNIPTHSGFLNTCSLFRLEWVGGQVRAAGSMSQKGEVVLSQRGGRPAWGRSSGAGLDTDWHLPALSSARRRACLGPTRVLLAACLPRAQDRSGLCSGISGTAAPETGAPVLGGLNPGCLSGIGSVRLFTDSQGG